MAQQTTYPNNPPPALNGQRSQQYGDVVPSKITQGVVSIGLLAQLGTQSLSVPGSLVSTGALGSPGQIAPLQAGILDNPILDSEFFGIPVLDTAFMQIDQITTATTGTFSVSAYLNATCIPVLRKGRIWVLSDAATTQGTNVYVYTTAQANQPLGSWGAAAGGGKALFTRGRWFMTTTTAGLSMLEVW